MIQATNDSYATEVLESSEPVLVYFSAEWCQPCKIFKPTLDELEEEFGDKVKFIKVDADTASEITKENEVRSIPTLMLVKGGAIQKKIVGLSTKNDVANALKDLVG